MGNIVLLDELTINKIAAGEVIERPASVVKEMVENSIDAGATSITVEIKNGGISFIRITDNGKGIAKDDTEIAFERHATSKIRQASDIETIHSMGFRGEALASIAAVANVELITKTANDEIGTRLVVEAGKVLEHEEIGCKTGTSITVRNLFFNTPVRYKFLKKDFTESGYIEDAITRLALVNPNIAFKLINTGKTIIQTAGNGDIQAVIYGIYGKNIAENVLKVDYTYEDIHISGVIGKPEIARSNRSNQLFFVNNRYVKDKTLSGAIEKGFKGLLTIGKYAFSILNIEMDPSKVDVNVHPAKLEVRFSDESKIFKSVYHAVNDTLLKNDLIKNSDRGEEKNNLGTTSLFGNRSTIGAEINNNRFNSLLELQRKIKEDLEKSKKDINYNPFKKEEEEKEEINKTEETKTIVTTNPVEETTHVETEPKVENTNNSVKTEEVVTEPKEDKKLDIKELEEASKEIDKQIENLTNNNIKEEEKKESFDEMYFKIFGTKPPKIEDDNQKQEPQAITKEDNTTLFDNIEDDYKYKQQYKFIGIVFNTYIIFEMDDEMYIMDQHAAHEKVMYEKYMKSIDLGSVARQQLSPPLIITLSAEESQIVNSHYDEFYRLGFEISDFGGNEYAISCIPAELPGISSENVLIDVLTSLSKEKDIEDAPGIFYEKVASMACKSAVKGGRRITETEAYKLVCDLFTLDNPFCCPHGRPTIIKTKKSELEKQFGRIV